MGATSDVAARMWRFEVRPRATAGDPKGRSVAREAGRLGVRVDGVRSSRVYLVHAAMTDEQADRVRDELLANPVLETGVMGSGPMAAGERVIEVHPLPGVMDPAAATVRDVVGELTGVEKVEVSTGWRYDIAGIDEADTERLARELLANAVVDQVHFEPWTPEVFPEPTRADQTLRLVELTSLDDPALEQLSRDGHLFLSLDEMRAIRAEYRRQGREPTDVELETLAQTWSEHCVHKTLKSTIRYTPHAGDIIDWSGRPGHEVQRDGAVVIHNLLKSTVAAATHELIADGLDWTLSVFVDNAGIIAFDDDHAVCVKVETHNHPSAIEPYGGAATGIGGCIRDIMGTGLAARPIANTDVFCVGTPDIAEVPAGCLHPRRILTRVVDGVRDYGNRMGIPTVNGAVWFDDRFVGNPLVFCGCVGVMPRDLVEGDAAPGDRIIALGGRTGRDGIHGATFSSAELTDTHADEFSHAVQIGAPIEEKRTLDAILRARDHAGGCLYRAITDCGAGGFSSAVGEMGETIGAEVELANAPLKYVGLRYDEIWISESQERMVLAVPAENVAAVRAICQEEGVELADLGEFGTPDRELILRYEGAEVGRLSMAFLHEGVPMPTREAVWEGEARRHEGTQAWRKDVRAVEEAGIKDELLRLLSDPNIASKRWIVRQYDHEVQGNTVVKPLVGEGGVGPGDAAVIQPVPGSRKGLAIACGLQIPVGDPARGGDPYLMALAAVDECVRNLVCVGADPDRIAILDNFCWPSCAKPENLGALVRAAEGCYDAAKAYKTPFVSGKDSLNNQFRREDGSVIEIPPTLLITGVGIVDDVERCVTMDAKDAGGAMLAIPPRPSGDLAGAVAASRAVAELIDEGLVVAAHDCSEGGIAVALAEMLLAGEGVGVETLTESGLTAEGVGGYVLQVCKRGMEDRASLAQAEERLAKVGRQFLGWVKREAEPRLTLHGGGGSVTVRELREAHLGTLDW